MSEKPVQPLPLDYASTRTTRTPGPMAKFFLSKLGWPSYLIYAAIFVLWWIGASYPAGKFAPIMLAIAGLTFMSMTWFLRLIIRGGVARYFGQSIPYKDYLPWLALPILVVSLVLVPLFGLPLKLGFALSKASMDNLAQDALNSVATQFSARRAGIYRMQGIEVFPAGTVRMECSSGFASTGGFIYSPDQFPQAGSEEIIAPLWGGWYYFENRF